MIVIFGASGKVGRVTATNLRHAGRPVRAVVRDARQAAYFAAIGCETVLADLTEPPSVRKAVEGAEAVQMLCPVPENEVHPESLMRKMIDVAADTLLAHPPAAVLALSDYGAEVPHGTGITQLYRYLETRFKPIPTRLTLLRSAEHMQNWSRVIHPALAKGFLPSLHHPVNKRFPTVAAQDVGAVAAELLLDDMHHGSPRIVSVEGPRRISANDVAGVLGDISGKDVSAIALPRKDWEATLDRAGLSEYHAKLIVDLYDAHNAGKIDVEEGKTERRFGTTPISEVLSSLVASAPDSERRRA